MYYLRARYYNPATGRFLSMDPDAGLASDPATLHRYVFTRNNPINMADPTGEADIAENVIIRFSTHGLDHLVEKGLELTQPEVEGYIQQLVREFLANPDITFGRPFDLPFIMSQLNNVPWAARVFIVSNALIEISTYFPINKP
jgi:hypothetical protein